MVAAVVGSENEHFFTIAPREVVATPVTPPHTSAPGWIRLCDLRWRGIRLSRQEAFLQHGDR